MKGLSALGIAGTLCWLFGGVASSQEFNQLSPVPIQSVTVEDSFWSPKRKVWQEITIPDCFTKFENDRGEAWNNFDRVLDGKSKGHAAQTGNDCLVLERIVAPA